MPPFLQFLIRFIAVPITLIIITMLLYAGAMLTPPIVRVTLYYHPGGLHMTEEEIARVYALKIKQYHLDDPFLFQYWTWAKYLVQGTWGYSPTLNEDVLPAPFFAL